MRQYTNLYNSLCVIQGYSKGQSFSAQGILISPFHILSSKHCVIGTDVTVFSNEGQFSKLTRRGIQDTKLDLAVVELEDPIGQSYSSCFTNDNFSADHLEGTLISNFRMAGIQETPVELDTLKTKFNQQYKNLTNSYGHERSRFAYFNTKSLQFGPGYSGCPIVNKDGRIITIASSVWTKTQAEFEIIKTNTGKIVETPHPFVAPNPKEFANFISYVYNKFG